MNNYFPFLGVGVCVGIAVLPAIFNLFGGAGGEHIYKYSLGFRVFLWMGSLCILFSGVAFRVFGSNPGPSDMQLVLSVLLGLLLVIGCVYTDKYQILLTADGIEFGAFRKVFIRYSEITGLRRISGRTTILEIHAGERAYSLSGNVQGFGGLCEFLERNCGKNFK